MAYTSITPLSGSFPSAAPSAVAGSTELKHYDGADVYVDVGSGSGVFALLQYGPGDKWRQIGPQWTADTSVSGGQPARFVIPSDPGFYYHIYKVSGTVTVTSAYIVGVRRGG